MMEVGCSSEMLESTYQITKHHYPILKMEEAAGACDTHLPNNMASYLRKL
jgi:hypothetical protein